jgi:hypothetical protein
MHNRVFLLGAGFSCAISSEMPTMKDLSNAVEESIAAKGLPPIPGSGTAVSRNFEQWLSYLIESPPWLPESDQLRNRAAFNDVALAVHDVLVARQTAAVANGACPDWLRKLVNYWEVRSSTVITFNYDLFIDLVAIMNFPGKYGRTPGLISVPDVISRAGTVSSVSGGQKGLRLLKLHGSLNWRYSGPGGNPGDVIYDMGLNGADGWSVSGIGPQDDDSERLLSDREPMIVPPAAVKSPYYNNRTLRALWMDSAQALRKADELVMMGFSLPVTDLLVASMLTTNLPESATIVPVNYSGDVNARVRDTFGLAEGVDDDRLVATFADDDLKDAAIPSWVDRFANLA